jgi:hypothetical protein
MAHLMASRSPVCPATTAFSLVLRVALPGFFCCFAQMAFCCYGEYLADLAGF